LGQGQKEKRERAAAKVKKFDVCLKWAATFKKRNVMDMGRETKFTRKNALACARGNNWSEWGGQGGRRTEEPHCGLRKKD